MTRFRDRVAIVTGAASGIGLATAKRLGREGARVVIADLAKEQADEATAAVRGEGAPDVHFQVCNVANEHDVIATVDAALKSWGRIDVVVNNAGVMTFTAIPETTGDDWIRVLSIDLLGAFYFTKQAFQNMQKGGAIVNVASIHAVETSPLVAPYAAAKSALLSLTRSAALEGNAKGIRVNAVLPGAVDTPMLWKNPNVVSGVEKIDRAVVGMPDDIAAAIAFLASDDAKFVQGAQMRVDGGRLNRL